MYKYKRFINPIYSLNDENCEDIKGVEIRIVKLDKYPMHEFLIMSTGIIYIKVIDESTDKYSGWKYLWDDTCIVELSSYKNYYIDQFKCACHALTMEHLELYGVLYRNAEKNQVVIRKAITNYKTQLQYLFSKVNINEVISDVNFEPWI